MLTSGAGLCFLTIVVGYLAATPAGAKNVSAAVGQVRDQIVTSREVQINQAIDQALYRPAKTAIRILTDTDSALFGKQVTSVLLEWVVFLEAKQVAVAAVSGSEVQEAVSRAKKELASVAAWQKLKASANEIEGVVERKLQAKKFIRFRADSSVVPISDAEAQRYFEANRLRFGDLPFENFKANVKGYLARQQAEKRLKDWFEVLRAKYRVRNFLAEL